MISIRNNKGQQDDIASVNLIGNGTKISGDITSSGDVRIDGQLTGNIVTSGKFVLGPNGLVDGNISCSNADLMGEVKGQVTVSELLQLKQTARINGDISTGKLSIEPGAVFTGNCSMGARVKNISEGSQPGNASKTA
jgi:cytoskeletal protein CcmA (bactofilin family)